MADDLQNYKLQQQQVEAALLTDPENTELLKLKQDLDEVIELTRDLIKTQLEEQKTKSAYVEPSTSHKRGAYQQQAAAGGSGASTSAASTSANPDAESDDEAPSGNDDDYDDVERALLAAEKTVNGAGGAAGKTWRVGDQCQAKWTEDGVYYDATIESIAAGGAVQVVFDAYQNRSATTLRELKERLVRNEVFPGANK